MFARIPVIKCGMAIAIALATSLLGATVPLAPESPDEMVMGLEDSRTASCRLPDKGALSTAFKPQTMSSENLLRNRRLAQLAPSCGYNGLVCAGTCASDSQGRVYVCRSLGTLPERCQCQL